MSEAIIAKKAQLVTEVAEQVYNLQLLKTAFYHVQLKKLV